MRTRQLLIGEHLVSVSYPSDRWENVLESNYICLPHAAYNRTADLIIAIEDGYGVPFVDYEVRVSQREDRITYRRADYLIETDTGFQTARVAVQDELALKHALMNLYSSYIVHHNWGLMLHASCAVERGRAQLFAGPSGAGKSTAAKWSSPRELLSDEAALVKIAQDQITVFNSPFRSELKATGREPSAALAGIQLLVQAPYNQRILLSQSDGFLQLIDKVFYWAHHPEETGNVLRSLRTLAQAVPVYELHFQNNSTFWELIADDSVRLEKSL